MDTAIEGFDMAKLKIGFLGLVPGGWGVLQRDGTVRYFSDPLAALRDMLREGEDLEGDMCDFGLDDFDLAVA